MRGKRGVAVFMLSPNGAHEPVPAGADVLAAGRRTSTTSPSTARSTIARTSSRRVAATPRSRRAIASARSTRSTGRASRRRSSTTSRATSRPRRANDERVAFAVPSGNFGNILAGARRARDGPADRAPGARHQRERRARRILPHRPLSPARRRGDARDVVPVDGHLEGVELRALHVRPRRPRPARVARAVAVAGARRRLRPARHTGVRARCRRRASCPAAARHADRLATIRDVLTRYGSRRSIRTPPTASGSAARCAPPAFR